MLTGGRPTDGGLGGYFYEPTVLVDVDNDMRVVREEIFGPVAAIMPFDSEEEVVRLANDTEYGLAAGVWTSNLSGTPHGRAARGRTIWVNTYRAMSPMSPGLQEQRRRHRARHRDHQGVHPAQECLDQHQRGAGGRPVRAAELTVPLIEVTSPRAAPRPDPRMMHEVHEAVLRTVDTRPEHIRVIVREVPEPIGPPAI